MKQKMLLALSAVLLVFYSSSTLAQEFDPFNPGTPKPRDSRSSSAPAIVSPSAAFTIKLNANDQRRLDECREQAAARGVDIAQISFASGYLNVPYDDSACTRFVVEKMYQGMQVAMQQNPEALSEFQRNKPLQDKMAELKKALGLLGSSTAGRPNPYVRFPDAASTVFKSNSERSLNEPVVESEEKSVVNRQGSYVPAEYWSYNYSPLDAQRMLDRQAGREAIYKRNQVPEGTPSLLRDTVQNAEKGQAEAENNARERMQSYRR